jgi:cell division protease FtsH
LKVNFMITIKKFTDDLALVRETVAKVSGFDDPVLVDPYDKLSDLLVWGKKRAVQPLNDALVYSWDRDKHIMRYPAAFGIGIYQLDGIPFAYVTWNGDEAGVSSNHRVIAVARRNYLALYRAINLRRRQDKMKRQRLPILASDLLHALWSNTIGFLQDQRLERITKLGGRPKRGILLAGPPGNGKTMTCRWLADECKMRGMCVRNVTPDEFRASRSRDETEELFSLPKKGLIFFDDLDFALRDRESSFDVENQSIFLTSLDGLRPKSGVVYVFSTNLDTKQIDSAFKRPGRLDLLLTFTLPDSELRQRLINEWHGDLLSHIDIDVAVEETAGRSFAEIDEIKNLLVMQLAEKGDCIWNDALEQFIQNRPEVLNAREKIMGFGIQTKPIIKAL